MVALNQMPISFCSSPGFHYFMSIVEPNYKAIKEKALKKRLFALKIDIKKKVKKNYVLLKVYRVLLIVGHHCHNNHT